MGSSLRPNTVQHFSSISKTISNNNEAIDQGRSNLSLWMGQGSQNNEINLPELHQVESINPATMYIETFAPCTNPQSTADYQFTWAYGSKQSSSCSGELTSTSLQTCNLKESSSPHIVSVPSLYSTQHHNHHPTPTDMSATALLQKAAQIGVTSTVPSFLGGLGVKCSTQLQGGNKYNGQMGLNPFALNFGANLENSIADIASSNQSQLYQAKHQSSQKDDQEGGQTRDFLGVGVQTLCSSSIHGWI